METTGVPRTRKDFCGACHSQITNRIRRQLFASFTSLRCPFSFLFFFAFLYSAKPNPSSAAAAAFMPELFAIRTLRELITGMRKLWRLHVPAERVHAQKNDKNKNVKKNKFGSNIRK